MSNQTPTHKQIMEIVSSVREIQYHDYGDKWEFKHWMFDFHWNGVLLTSHNFGSLKECLDFVKIPDLILCYEKVVSDIKENDYSTESFDKAIDIFQKLKEFYSKNKGNLK